jgi:hypothetical protein
MGQARGDSEMPRRFQQVLGIEMRILGKATTSVSGLVLLGASGAKARFYYRRQHGQSPVTGEWGASPADADEFKIRGVPSRCFGAKLWA